MQCCRRLGLVLAAASLFFTASILGLEAVSAQPMDLDTPADSPLWWTLSPDFSPEDLRREYLDPAGTLRRYQEAVDAGFERPLSAEAASRLGFYMHPRLDPQLTAMWHALVIFGDHLQRRGAEAILEDLATFGISEQGQKSILAAMYQFISRAETISSKTGPQQIEFQLLIRKATAEGLPEAALDFALTQKDVEFFAAAFSRPKSEIEDLLEAMNTNSAALAGGEALVKLKEELTPADWERFRSHLLALVRKHAGQFADYK